MSAIAQAPEVPTLILEPTVHAPKIARDFVAKCFCDLGIADDYPGRTVVSELVTNVCEHVQTGHIVVRVIESENRSVLIEIWDQGEGMPVLCEAGENAGSGRGLFLISMLVRDWGVRPISEGGKIVWAELDR
ncbi:ATP-binding protein [Actinomadura spongiicola]|uniref:ATP-binding protein n=1 Tax=Actinomadura spongiicola TaxID=2303421 RepID=A0A372GLX1_9ACTN|nr:ATP-binding protein [Actinomadura spongiicola]RFS86345.1 ATP-binding protein [Actinomadura spongiicola]